MQSGQDGMMQQAQAAADPAAAGEAAGPADGAASASEPVEVPTAQQGDGNQPSQPLPLPYQLDADGKKQPLPGSKSIFVRGGTAEAFGLAALSNKPDGQLMAAVPKEKLLADIQFQGAISDFHPIKAAVQAADYDPLLIRLNEDDLYGDGNNFEVAVTQAAAEAWLAADEAAAAAAVAAAAAAGGGAAAGGDDAQGPSNRRKQRREPRPWQDLGTEAELEAAGIYPITQPIAAPQGSMDAARRSSSTSSGGGSGGSTSLHSRSGAAAGSKGPSAVTGLLLTRPRKAFGAQVLLSDAPASDLWASNTMEVWPFKDPAYDLKKLTMERPAQAVPVLQEAAVQATGGRPRNSCCQTVPQSLPEEEAEDLMAAPGFAAFLEAVRPRLDDALLQNSIADIMTADLDQLGDEEPDGLVGGAAGSAAGARSSVAGAGAAGSGGGHQQERGGLTEAQTFSDLAYSKNKVVKAICWVPGRRGVVAAACTDLASQTQRLATMGRLSPAHILIWNFRDPVHPEYVLESPHEVTTFQYNPLNPDIIIGGCYNGQIVLWDTSSTAAATAGGSNGSHAGGAGSKGGAGGGAGGSRAGGKGSSSSAGAWDDGGEAEAITPVIRHKYLSSVEHSHTTTVCDICWLPGIELDRAGKVFSIRANSAGTSAQSMLRSLTLGSTAMAAAAAGSNIPREACFFASIAPDGKVMFWDVRLDKLLKKGNKRVDETDVVWKPMHVVHVLSVAGNDFTGCCFCFDPYRLDSSNFVAGSMEGELLAGHFNRPPGDENPDYCKLVFGPHAGPVVALCVSPFLPELLLSVGDWTFRLWHHGIDSQVALFVSPQAEDMYTAAAWSPSRPGLLFLATAAGTLQVWDLLDRSHEPSLTISASSTAITSLAFSNSTPKHFTHGSIAADGGSNGAGAAGGSSASAAAGGANAGAEGHHHHHHGGGQQQGSGLQVLAVGDAAGVLHLFELPRTLRRPLQNEKRLMEAFVGREAARLADVASRQSVRAAALANMKQQEEGKKGTDDSSSMQDQQQPADAAAARQSTISSSQCGTLAAAPAAVSAGGVGSVGRASGVGLGVGVQQAGGAAARAAELAKAEATYRALEAEFKEQLHLA